MRLNENVLNSLSLFCNLSQTCHYVRGSLSFFLMLFRNAFLYLRALFERYLTKFFPFLQSTSMIQNWIDILHAL